MAIKSQKDIYNVLEKYLRSTQHPLTVNMLMDISEIRRIALEELSPDNDEREATNKLSDVLGFMWRRGLVVRYPAPRESHSFARFAYIWDEDKELKGKAKRIPLEQKSLKKVGVAIEEIEDGVVLEFDKFSITIRSKA